MTRKEALAEARRRWGPGAFLNPVAVERGELTWCYVAVQDGTAPGRVLGGGDSWEAALTKALRNEAQERAEAKWGEGRVVVCPPGERRRDHYSIWAHDPEPEYGGDTLLGMGDSWEAAFADADRKEAR